MQSAGQQRLYALAQSIRPTSEENPAQTAMPEAKDHLPHPMRVEDMRALEGLMAVAMDWNGEDWLKIDVTSIHGPESHCAPV